MPDYLVELRTIGREVFSVHADSPEAAKEGWMDGELVVSECVSVEEISSVKEEEGDD